MPTNENLYGQWPRCGEIDIMEVLGDATKTAYGTIHYGNPHSESQGKHTLENGDYSEEFHTFTCEWEPGVIKWYVDGTLFHTEDSWYTRTVGQGEVTYPAPFDQPFYMILNLAVGGNWPGNPDETTQDQPFVIDYVRAYQKDSYDDNVEKPIKEVILRDPDANGNYINNGNFAVEEDLTDSVDWQFLLAKEGEGKASIADNKLKIETTKVGTEDYAVQLVQANLPMQKGGIYRLSFDAYADAARTMKVDVSAPDRSYQRYLADTVVNLGTEKQTYTYEFTMTDENDANGRLEYNLGKTSSKATVYISNVKVEKIGQKDMDDEDKKTILRDGNHVYNGGFQEGDNRLGFWEYTIKSNANLYVTNDNTVRRLKVNVKNAKRLSDVVLKQSDLAFAPNKQYAVSFDAEVEEDKKIEVVIAGVKRVVELKKGDHTYDWSMTTGDELTNKDIEFHLGSKGVLYLDNVRVVEDSLIKNGDFSADFAGYEVYADSATDVDYVVDSQREDNAASITIRNTGDQDWQIQLKQNNVKLEEGQWYHLKLDAKSDLDRKLMFAIQRDGSKDDNWIPYSGQKVVSLTKDYQTFDLKFQMTEETDLRSILSISMGAVEGKQITERHTICIDNISLEKIDEPAEGEENGDLIKNGDFSAGFEGYAPYVFTAQNVEYKVDSEKEDSAASFTIKNTGDAAWQIQLKQNDVKLEEGQWYHLKLDAKSTLDRKLMFAIQRDGSKDDNWDPYSGEKIVDLTKDYKTFDVKFQMTKATDLHSILSISMGAVADQPIDQEHTICIDNISLEKIEAPQK